MVIFNWIAAARFYHYLQLLLLGLVTKLSNLDFSSILNWDFFFCSFNCVVQLRQTLSKLKLPSDCLSSVFQLFGRCPRDMLPFSKAKGSEFYCHYLNIWIAIDTIQSNRFACIQSRLNEPTIRQSLPLKKKTQTKTKVWWNGPDGKTTVLHSSYSRLILPKLNGWQPVMDLIWYNRVHHPL